MTARDLARRYRIEEAQAEPGFQAVIEDVAGWLLFNKWHPRRSRRGRTPILETVRQDAESEGSIVLRRVREQHPAKMLLQIHDELIFESPAADLPSLIEMVRTEMTTALELDVPLEIDLSVGDNWLES